MNKDCIPIIQILAMLLVALMFGKSSTTAAQTSPTPKPLVAILELPYSDRPSDINGLVEWLEKAAAWPEAAAGSSLRLALLAAELADWAAGNPDVSPAVKAELLSYLCSLNEQERADLIRHLSLLRGFCASLTPRQYREILEDAGMDAASAVPEIGSLSRLLQEISDAAASMSIQSLAGKNEYSLRIALQAGRKSAMMYAIVL